MSWLWALIVGGLIGLVAGAITKRGGSMGLISNIIAGLGRPSGKQSSVHGVRNSLEWQLSLPSLVR